MSAPPPTHTDLAFDPRVAMVYRLIKVYLFDKSIYFSGKFISVNASWPGACHDAHVFKTSRLAANLTREHLSLADGVLLGDSGYVYTL